MLDRRATTSGFTIVSKMPARKPEEEREILKWIEDVMEEPVPKGDYEEVRPDLTFSLLHLCFR